jgi:hypothetical protein
MDDREAYEFYKDPEHLRIIGRGRKPRRWVRLTEVLSIRFTAATLGGAKKWAAEDGVTVSTWIRLAVAREEERRRRKWLDEHRHDLEVIPGSARLGERRAIPSSLGPGTFACEHLSVGNVASASCGQCGPLARIS